MKPDRGFWAGVAVLAVVSQSILWGGLYLAVWGAR
jgi:hypothetical protein